MLYALCLSGDCFSHQLRNIHHFEAAFFLLSEPCGGQLEIRLAGRARGDDRIRSNFQSLKHTLIGDLAGEFGIESLHSTTAATAFCQKPVVLEFEQSDSWNFLEQFSRGFEDVEMATQIAGVMVGHLHRVSILELQLSILNQLIEIFDRMKHRCVEGEVLGVDLFKGLIATRTGGHNLLGLNF